MPQKAEVLSAIDAKAAADEHHTELVSYLRCNGGDKNGMFDCLIAGLLNCSIAHTHLNDDTLAKHGEAVGDSAALAVVPAVQNLVDNLFKKMKEEGCHLS